jgi:hypothetical protein
VRRGPRLRACAARPRTGRAPAGRRPARAVTFSALAGALTLAAGCGAARQDAHEPKGTYSVEVLRASFPNRQTIARPAQMLIEVRNPASRAIPNVAISVDSFNYASNYPQLADRSRPVWALERGPDPGTDPSPAVETQEVSLPGNAQTAYVNTWALGPLGAGQTRTFTWRVIPVIAGTHTVHYAVAAGLAGKARAAAVAGGRLGGQFAVLVAKAPPQTVVNPATGKVVVGSAPPAP